MRLTLATLALCLLSLSPLIATAQIDLSPDDDQKMYTTTALTAGGTTLVALSFLENFMKSGAMGAKQEALIEHYLNTNQHQLEEALLIGGGPVVDDLVTLLGLPASERRALGMRLRRRRAALLSIIHETGTHRAHRFVIALFHG